MDRSFGMIGAPLVELNELSYGMRFVSGKFLYLKMWLFNDFSSGGFQSVVVVNEKKCLNFFAFWASLALMTLTVYCWLAPQAYAIIYLNMNFFQRVLRTLSRLDYGRVIQVQPAEFLRTGGAKHSL